MLYAFMTALDDPSRVIHEPGGYLLAPKGIERGRVSNVTFSNGWVARADGQVLLYYASSDTRCHVATTTVKKLVELLPAHSPRPAPLGALCPATHGTDPAKPGVYARACAHAGNCPAPEYPE